jgi:nucleoside 2-deoxyribosyltransferase
MTTFYTAGKVWHNKKFQYMRDVLGMPVKARWIDLEQDSDIVTNHKDELWRFCYEDVRDSDFLMLYSFADDEEQRGALVEIGMAFAFNKPVYAVGTCKTIQPNKISDVAFTHFEGFHWLPETDLKKGFRMAEKMYLQQRKALKLSA